jgi:hypothetical protein
MPARSEISNLDKVAHRTLPLALDTTYLSPRQTAVRSAGAVRSLLIVLTSPGCCRAIDFSNTAPALGPGPQILQSRSVRYPFGAGRVDVASNFVCQAAWFEGGRDIRKEPACDSRRLRSFKNVFLYARSLNSEGTIYFTLYRSKPIFQSGRSFSNLRRRAFLDGYMIGGHIFASLQLQRRPDASLARVRHLQRVQRGMAVGTNRHGNRVGSLQSNYVYSP